MIRLLVRTPDGALELDCPLSQLQAAVRDAALIWLDFEGADADEARRILLDVFDFHRLAVDDALLESHLPRLDDWGDYTYLNLHAFELGQGGSLALMNHELDVFLGSNFLLTHHAHALVPVTRLWQAAARDERLTARGPAYLLYHLADGLIADMMPIVEGLDLELDQLEDEIFDSPGREQLERIFGLRRVLLRLRRGLGPQREVFHKLARGDSELVPAETRVYFRDVYDHLVRLHDLVEGLRDLVGGALDTYLSVVSNRMNEVIKTLTVITTVFMPLAFITGFFGMNFFQAGPGLQDWTEPRVMLLALAVMLLLPAFMLLWMRRRGWL